MAILLPGLLDVYDFHAVALGILLLRLCHLRREVEILDLSRLVFSVCCHYPRECLHVDGRVQILDILLFDRGSGA